MFFKRKLTAIEAKIIGHIGLQKQRAENEKYVLKAILQAAKDGKFEYSFPASWCAPLVPMLTMLGYKYEDTMTDYGYDVKPRKVKGIKVSW